MSQSNLATAYEDIGRLEDGIRIRQDVYSRRLELYGEAHVETITAAFNYSSMLIQVNRFEEAKSLLRKMTPVARRVLGNNNYDMTLRMSAVYANALYNDPSATLDDLRESVTTLEDTAPIARRVLGSAHPLTKAVAAYLQDAQAALRAREETASSSA